MTQKRNYKKIAVVLAIFWGVLLAIGGALNGNQAVLESDLTQEKESVLERTISSNALNCWIVNNRSGFNLVEFAKDNACTTELSLMSNYKCMDVNQLADLKWIRKNFRSLNRQLIVYNRNPDQNLYAAALLTHYGYKVRMLGDTQNLHIENSSSMAKNQNYEIPTTPAIVPVSNPVNSDVNEEEYFEEEEEEGC
jgi:hypothetical protein